MKLAVKSYNETYKLKGSSGRKSKKFLTNVSQKKSVGFLTTEEVTSSVIKKNFLD
jgi:hypothetical protein